MVFVSGIGVRGVGGPAARWCSDEGQRIHAPHAMASTTTTARTVSRRPLERLPAAVVRAIVPFHRRPGSLLDGANPSKLRAII
jgi:hypothetical protein